MAEKGKVLRAYSTHTSCWLQEEGLVGDQATQNSLQILVGSLRLAVGLGGSREVGVTDEMALLASGLLRGCVVTTMLDCLPKNPWNCSRKMSNARVMVFSQRLDPLHKATKQFLVPPDGGSLGDGIA